MPPGILLNLTAGLPLPVQFLILLLETPVILFKCLGFTEIGKSVLDLQLEFVFPIRQLVQFPFGKSIDQLKQTLCLTNASIIGFGLSQMIELLLTVKAKRQAVEESLGISQIVTMHGRAAVLPDNAIFDAVRTDPAYFHFCTGCIQAYHVFGRSAL